ILIAPRGLATGSKLKHPAPHALRACVHRLLPRYVRILLRGSSGTAPIGSTDVLDSLGFAIDELYFGIIDDTGAFQDMIDHSLSNRSQTITYTSSTDPGIEQPI